MKLWLSSVVKHSGLPQLDPLFYSSLLGSSLHSSHKNTYADQHHRYHHQALARKMPSIFPRFISYSFKRHAKHHIATPGTLHIDSLMQIDLVHTRDPSQQPISDHASAQA